MIIALRSALADATERDFQKIDFQRELPDLGLHLLGAGTLFWSALLSRRHEHADRAIEQLGLPLRDLVGVHVELLGQLRQRPVALQRRQGNLRLERRRMVPSRPSHCTAPLRAISSPIRAGHSPKRQSRFSEPALFGERERVLLLESELEAKGYTRAESEAARGAREYYLAQEPIKTNYPGREINEDGSLRMVLIWDSEELN
jgi:hypothetical protein